MYDTTKIGERIASGGDRVVYRYGTDQVIKMSTLWFLTGKKLHAKLARDYRICKTYLPDFVLETEDVTGSDERRHVELQPFVDGEMLTRAHARDPRTRQQIEQIREGIRRMSADGYPPIDLVGHIGMLRRCLSNILVDRTGNLKIIDTTLLEVRSVMPIGIVFMPFLPLIRARQNALLREFTA